MPRSLLAIVLGLVAVLGSSLGYLAGGGGTYGASTPAFSPPSFADVVSRVNPAVVHISVVEGSGRVGPTRRDFSSLPRRGEGSGFVVDSSNGYILTNHHLVGTATHIRVRLADKREATATLVGTDVNTDLALVQVPLRALQEIRMGDSDRVRVGEWVCAIGNPYIFDHSVTVGVVSSKGRKIWDPSFDSFIQTDAAINPGNSGGPLIDFSGQAIGINSAVSTEGQGIGFAVPINVAKEILGQLKAHGKVSRGYLGVQLHELDPDLSPLVGSKAARGAMVLDVLHGSAAEAAGVKRYDVITAVGGARVEDGDQLIREVSMHAPGSRVELKVLRDGLENTLQADLTERVADPSPAPAGRGTDPADRSADRLGLFVTDLSAAMRSDLLIPADRTGVVVNEIEANSPAADSLDHGDIIVEVNRRPTPNLHAYRTVLQALRPGDVAWLFVYRPSTRPGQTVLVKVDVEGQR